MQKYCYIFFLTVISSFGCNNKTVTSEAFEDCFPERKNIKTHPTTEGIIKEVMNDFFAITIGDSKRYSPCNLDSKWKIEGMKVTFSGIEKEIYPHERRAATPFVLTEIKESK